jgi:hypothetical protein
MTVPNIAAVEIGGQHYVRICEDGRERKRRGPFPDAGAAEHVARKLIKSAAKQRSKNTRPPADPPAEPSPKQARPPEVVTNGAANNPTDTVANHELIVDLARFAETVLTERQVKKKWRFADEQWDALNNDAVVEAVEAEKLRRVRDGSAKRELAQKHIIKAPDVLNSLMLDDKTNPKHKIDSIKAMEQLATSGSQQGGGSGDRFIIQINLNGEDSAGNDVLRFDKALAPSPPLTDDDNASSKPRAIAGERDDHNGRQSI